MLQVQLLFYPYFQRDVTIESLKSQILTNLQLRLIFTQQQLLVVQYDMTYDMTCFGVRASAAMHSSLLSSLQYRYSPNTLYYYARWNMVMYPPNVTTLWPHALYPAADSLLTKDADAINYFMPSSSPLLESPKAFATSSRALKSPEQPSPLQPDWCKMHGSPPVSWSFTWPLSRSISNSDIETLKKLGWKVVNMRFHVEFLPHGRQQRP